MKNTCKYKVKKKLKNKRQNKKPKKIQNKKLREFKLKTTVLKQTFIHTNIYRMYVCMYVFNIIHSIFPLTNSINKILRQGRYSCPKKKYKKTKMFFFFAQKKYI